MSSKRALVTGVTGQDGSYLAELLLEKGYEVHGLIRRSSTINTARIDHLFQDPHSGPTNFILHYSDLSDFASLTNLLSSIQPDEVYNLAAQSHVRVSFDMPIFTSQVTGLSTTALLEAIRIVNPEIKFYQASSSEMFGSSPPPQSELTSFVPQSPYAVAKLYSFWMTRNYREAYGLHATNGILFNHESPRRGETFVTRKITIAAARIKLGLQEKLFLGNIDSIRDWGYAPEFVHGMWQMLQQSESSDYVLATGVGYTVRDFLQFSFSALDLNWQDYVEFDPRYLRPTEVDALIGQSEKARNAFGWEAKTLTPQLAEIMVLSDFEKLKRAH
jgi:GDPmannose 4,6-dehydratase